MENVTESTGWKARIAENWQRSRKTVRNYFLLIFLLGLLFLVVFFSRMFILVRPGQEAVIWKMFEGLASILTTRDWL